MIYIYILKCADNTFYTGITQCIDTRISQHNSKKVSYTRYRLPVEIVHVEQRPTRKEAARQERRIKNLGAKKYIIQKFAQIYNISLNL